MIDRTARNNLAEALRALSSGAISNTEFERRLFLRRTRDPAVMAIFSKGAWHLYSDLREYHLTGRDELDETTRSEVARWVLFLKTDLPYEWPVPNALLALGRLLVNLLTLGRANRLFAARFSTCGDTAVWPFIKKSDYDAAQDVPPYLNNRS